LLNAEVRQKSQNRKSMILKKKKKSMFLHQRGGNGVCGAILAAFHTNFLCLIRIQRSCGLIPGGNMEQGVKFWGVEEVGWSRQDFEGEKSKMACSGPPEL